MPKGSWYARKKALSKLHTKVAFLRRIIFRVAFISMKIYLPKNIVISTYFFNTKGNIKLIFRMILPFKLRRLRHGHLRGVEHIFNENAVPRGGIVDQHVSHRADELAVLNDGRA